jgi:large subunit ribosomal protein L13
MKTIFLKEQDIERKWYHIDAEGQTLGRIAEKAVRLLRGKHKPAFTTNIEMGDYVIITNAGKIRVTGKKMQDKLYYRHSGYPSGLKSESLAKVLIRKPEYPLEHAIKGMLPKNRLGRKLFTNVKVYAGDVHPHTAQKPENIEIV